MNVIVEMGQFHFQPPAEKALQLSPLRRQQDFDVFPVQFRFAQNVFECGLNESKIDKKSQTPHGNVIKMV